MYENKKQLKLQTKKILNTIVKDLKQYGSVYESVSIL